MRQGERSPQGRVQRLPSRSVCLGPGAAAGGRICKAGRCHEVTAVRKAVRNWQPRAGGGPRGPGPGAVGGRREEHHPAAGLSAASRRIPAPCANFRTLAVAAVRCPFGAAGGLVRHLRNYEIN